MGPDIKTNFLSKKEPTLNQEFAERVKTALESVPDYAPVWALSTLKEDRRDSAIEHGRLDVVALLDDVKLMPWREFYEDLSPVEKNVLSRTFGSLSELTLETVGLVRTRSAADIVKIKNERNNYSLGERGINFLVEIGLIRSH